MLVGRPRTHRRTRNPQQTRGALLASAYDRIYESGFQGTDIDTILEAAGVTKGALYHHFKDKEALGHAVIEESIVALMRPKWVEPLANTPDPIGALIAAVRSTSLEHKAVRGGCALNNLAQEMSPLDEGFRTRLAAVFELWLGSIERALRRGRKAGSVRRDIDPREVAIFVVATYEGYVSLAKNAQDPRVLAAGMKRLCGYLTTLRPRAAGRPAERKSGPASYAAPSRGPSRS
jgi:AcrR family transcriptional regulator